MLTLGWRSGGRAGSCGDDGGVHAGSHSVEERVVRLRLADSHLARVLAPPPLHLAEEPLLLRLLRFRVLQCRNIGSFEVTTLGL